MAEDLAARLGRPLEIRDVEWDGIIPALQSGKIDAIISSMTRTPEREQAIAFSEGYVTNGLCLLVGKDSAIQSAADLKPGIHKIAVKLATTGHQWARSELPGMELIILDTSAACALEVVQGKADAFIYDQISIYQHWKQNEAKPVRSSTPSARNLGDRPEEGVMKPCGRRSMPSSPTTGPEGSSMSSPIATWPSPRPPSRKWVCRSFSTEGVRTIAPKRPSSHFGARIGVIWVIFGAMGQPVALVLVGWDVL